MFISKNTPFVVPTVAEGPAYLISRFLHSVLRTLVGTTVQRNRQPVLLQNAGASECAGCKAHEDEAGAAYWAYVSTAESSATQQTARFHALD